MKRLLFCFLLCMSSFIASAQYPFIDSNNVLKLEALGWSGSTYLVRITNLAPCSTTFRIDATGYTGIDTTLPSGPVVIKLPGLPLSTPFVRAKRISGASCLAAPNNGAVVVGALSAVLPIKFTSFTVRKLEPNLIRLVFTCEEDNTIRYYRIKTSLDQKNWKEVMLIFPDGIQGSKLYTVLIKL